MREQWRYSGGAVIVCVEALLGGLGFVYLHLCARQRDHLWVGEKEGYGRMRGNGET